MKNTRPKFARDLDIAEDKFYQSNQTYHDRELLEIARNKFRVENNKAKETKVDKRKKQYRKNEVPVIPKVNEAWIKFKKDLNKPNNKALRDISLEELNMPLNIVLKKIYEYASKVEIRDKLNIVLAVGRSYYTLNNKTLKQLLDTIKEGRIINYSEDLESDERFIAEFERIETFSIIKNKKKDIKKVKKEGAFFKYTHNLKDLDLSELGIFTDVNSNNINNNCLYEALKYGGLSVGKLTKLRSLLVTHTIPKSKLENICDMIQIAINIKSIKYKTGKYKGDSRIETYGKKYEEVYNIGLYDEHYFIIKKIEITSFSIKNYEQVKNIKNYKNIIKIDNEKPKYAKNRYIDSYDIVKLLIENKDNLLSEIKNCHEIYSTSLDKKLLNKDSFETLEYGISSAKPFNEIIETEDFYEFKNDKNGKERKYDKFTFDFETNTSGKCHTPYLCCSYDIKKNKKKSFISNECGLKFLNSLENNSFIFAHNAGYDFRFIMKHLTVVNYIDKNNSLMSCTARFYNKITNKSIELIIHDSYKFIANRLADFGKMFKLIKSKEIMPYGIYTDENIKNRYTTIKEALKILKKKEHKQFIDNIINKYIKYITRWKRFYNYFKLYTYFYQVYK